jgi:hypothetical protein
VGLIYHACGFSDRYSTKDFALKKINEDSINIKRGGVVEKN